MTCSLMPATLLTLTLLFGAPAAKADWPPLPGTVITGTYKSSASPSVTITLEVLPPEGGNTRIKSPSGEVAVYAPDGALLSVGTRERYEGGRPYIQKGLLRTGMRWERDYVQHRNAGVMQRSLKCNVTGMEIYLQMPVAAVTCYDANRQIPDKSVTIKLLVHTATGLMLRMERSGGDAFPWGDDLMQITEVKLPPPPAIAGR